MRLLLLVGFGAVLVMTAPLEAEERVNVNEELRLLELGQTPPRRIPGASFRVAVFSYEDPDETGLGDAAAALTARAILTGSEVSSLGVLRYEGDLSPQRPGDLGYFDKVERVVAAQEVSLAVWGRVARNRDALLLDTYVQVPSERVESRFTWRIRLPQRMGAGELLARLRPNRFAVQRLRLPPSAAVEIRETAARLDELRDSPSDGARVGARLPQGQTYFLARREGEWVYLQVRGGAGGWARLPSCPDDCSAFLRGAAFVGGLLGYLGTGSPPRQLPGLTPEALAVADQLAALDALNEANLIDRSLELAQQWSRRGAETSGGGSGARNGVPPGGAGSANAVVLARLSRLLAEGFARALDEVGSDLDELVLSVHEGRLEPPVGVAKRPEAFERPHPGALSPMEVGLVYDRIQLDPSAIEELAFELVEVAFIDPRNPELLHNIAVLFRTSGDEGRADKAEHLAERALR